MAVVLNEQLLGRVLFCASINVRKQLATAPVKRSTLRPGSAQAAPRLMLSICYKWIETGAGKEQGDGDR